MSMWRDLDNEYEYDVTILFANQINLVTAHNVREFGNHGFYLFEDEANPDMWTRFIPIQNLVEIRCRKRERKNVEIQQRLPWGTLSRVCEGGWHEQCGGVNCDCKCHNK